MPKLCSECGEKAAARVRLEDGRETLLCAAHVAAAKRDRKRRKAAAKAAADPPPPGAAPAPQPVAAPAAPNAAPPDADGAAAAAAAAAAATEKRSYKAKLRDALALLASERAAHAAALGAARRGEAVANERFDELCAVVKDEERKRQRAAKAGTVQLEHAAAHAAQRVAELETALADANEQRTHAAAQLAEMRDQLADLELAGAASAGAGAADDGALAAARAERDAAVAECDAVRAEFDDATETARKRLAYAAQLVVQLETKVAELNEDAADKDEQFAHLRDELDATQTAAAESQAELATQRKAVRALEAKVAELETQLDDELLSDDGINLDAIPFLGKSDDAAAAAAAAASEREPEPAPPSDAEPATPRSSGALSEENALLRQRAERAERDLDDARRRLAKTEERLDAAQDRLVAVMLERSESAAAGVGSAAAAAAPAKAAGPPPPPPPMPSGPLVKAPSGLKIGPKSAASQAALASRASPMDQIFAKIKQGSVALKKVQATEKKAPEPTGFDALVAQIKKRDYTLEGKIKKTADGKITFRHAPAAVRPADIGEKRVLLDPVTGKPLGADIEIGGSDDDDESDDDGDAVALSDSDDPAPPPPLDGLGVEDFD